MARERPHRHSSITPDIRRLHSPDLFDMQSERPEDPEQFCILVQAMIGPAGEIGEESFDFVVCTPKWLAQSLRKDDYVFGRHYLLVEYYDYDIIFSALISLCQGITGSSWRQVAEQLGRYGKWEFEDYTERGHAR